jgi:putative flavoprotein involved in K+ transport
VSEAHDLVVIGGGQAGLAAAYHLQQRGADFIVLDAERRTGDAWRRRWDSLRLFTPARHDGLPGLPFPDAPGRFPTKDQVAEYLGDYVERFELPVRHETRASCLRRANGGFEVVSSGGTFIARAVIVATGANPVPRVPALAASLDPGVAQLHSSEYVNPERMPAGKVLVVGFGTSGAEIAEELGRAGRDVTISGTPTLHVPNPVLKVAGGLYWQILHNVLTIRTPVGRRVAPKAVGRGAPLIRVSRRQVLEAGVATVPRVTGVTGGSPVCDDGTRLDFDVIMWCTGYSPDYSWIDVPALTFDPRGWPVVPCGLPAAVSGLGFVGVPFQVGLTSSLLGGVGRDAAIVVDRLGAKRSA